MHSDDSVKANKSFQYVPALTGLHRTALKLRFKSAAEDWR
ncbi:hypothetical protein DET64_1118 [Marinobacter nauticus]|uniref:Uncharacterized protein n=1 Tax=Marinobacter nauticus TaxID=2743 RepID=A0A368UTN2_MARNT|nr:hypothetical protein DET64_1118 [Marinobacter nauticus]RCW31465.1 hypothetical protein DET51_1118 [Marinobacter nauticus]